MFINISSIL